MIAIIPTVLAVTSADPGDGAISLGLSLMVVGMSVVFVALMLIGAILGLLGKLMGQAPTDDETPAQGAAVTSATEAPQTSMATGLDDPRLVAVITAAATAAIGSRVKIRRIVSATQGGGAWSAMGRSAIHTSHNLRGSRR